ncbi:S-layer homology domain-containing protein [Acetivibrio cellulolyticus]|uniref:S-layer homology domain-containing protein n=1 Tax=Acetivibrio cellulolyticus TaxID=35830 RepID=UPI0001E2D89B|nr:S-layer homology domain-containing protein [Acetivibrio cellulolyticus]
MFRRKLSLFLVLVLLFQLANISPTLASDKLKGTIQVDVDDACEVYFNGQLIGVKNDDKYWYTSQTFSFEYDPDEKNVIAVKGWDVMGGYNAFAADILYDGKHILTNTNWKATNIQEDGWEKINYDDSKWNNATLMTTYRYHDAGISPPMVNRPPFIWGPYQLKTTYFRCELGKGTGIKGKLSYEYTVPDKGLTTGGKYNCPLEDTKVVLYEKYDMFQKKIDEVTTDKEGKFEYKGFIPSRKNSEVYFKVEAEDDNCKVMESETSLKKVTFISKSKSTKDMDGQVMDFGNVQVTPGEAFNIFKVIDKGAKFWSDQTGRKPSKKQVFMNSSSTFARGSERIYLTPVNYVQNCTILHEYGHCIMAQFTTFPAYPKDNSHIYSLNCGNSGMAYAEGWATFFAQSVLNTPVVNRSWGMYNLEDLSNAQNDIINRSELNEVSNASVMWDLLDANNENYSSVDAAGKKLSDTIIDGFANNRNVFESNSSISANLFSFYNLYNKLNSRPYEIWQIFAEYGMGNFDYKGPSINSVMVINPDPKANEIEALVTDDVKVAAVTFKISQRGYEKVLAVDDTAPFTCTIRASDFKTGSHILTIEAKDAQGNARSKSAKIYQNSLSAKYSAKPDITVSSSNAYSDEPLDLSVGNSTDESIKYMAENPIDENPEKPVEVADEDIDDLSQTIFAFNIDNGTGDIVLEDTSIDYVKAKVIENGYDCVKTSDVTMDSVNKSTKMEFNVQDGCEYNIMVDSSSGIFDLELYQPDGTLYKKYHNPSPPYGLKLKDFAPGTWSFSLVPSNVPLGKADTAIGIGERPSKVVLSQIADCSTTSSQTIQGSAIGANKVTMEVTLPDGSKTSYSEPVKDGYFIFENINFPVGKSTAIFKAINKNNFSGNTEERTIVIDSTPPVLDVTSDFVKPVLDVEDKDTVVYDNKVNISGKISEICNISINNKQVEVYNDEDGGYFFSYQVYLDNGKNDVTIKATDMAGNTSTKDMTYTKEGTNIYEEDEPVITQLIDIGGNKFKAEVIDKSLYRVEAFSDGKPLTDLGDYTFSFSECEDENPSITIRATDLWGNVGYFNIYVPKNRYNIIAQAQKAFDSDDPHKIEAYVYVENQSILAINPGILKLRYYYTVDGDSQQTIEKLGSDTNVYSIVKMENPCDNADYYVEIEIRNNEAPFYPGGFYGGFINMTKEGDSIYDESNDYSYNPNPNPGSYYNKVAVYYGDVLIGGTTPGTIATTPTSGSDTPATTTTPSPSDSVATSATSTILASATVTPTPTTTETATPTPVRSAAVITDNKTTPTPTKTSTPNNATQATSTPTPLITIEVSDNPIPASKPLVDIKGHWAETYIMSMYEKGIMSGYNDSTFKPDNKITRAEVIVVLMKLFGFKEAENINLKFKDTEEIPEWAKGYVQTAFDKGFIKGYNDNTFKANNFISRQEIAIMVVKALGVSVNSQKTKFKDDGKIPDWSKDYVAKAVELGIITGYNDNTFKASGNVSRAEIAAIAFKVLKYRN